MSVFPFPNSIFGIHVVVQSIKDVSALDNLDTLILRSCYGLTDISMLNNVRILNLSFCININKLFTYKKVDWNCYELYLSYTNISDVSMFKNIKKLYLAGCSFIHDISMLKNIEKLNIYFCLNIPQEQIDEIRKTTKCLHY